MARELEIRALGGLRLSVGGERVESLRARSAEALLVYLACQPKPMPREHLAELFWPERPAETSLANLRGALHRLRPTFAPFLQATRQRVGVREGALWLDAAEFERLLAERRLGEALALYRGAFLEDFHLNSSPAFEDWAALERARLHDLAVAALQACLSAALAEGQAEGALSLARRLLALEPFHEATHRVLVRLLAKTGGRAVALAHGERYCALLANEMGVALEPATLALLDEIRRGEGDAEGGGKGGGEAGGAAPTGTVTRYGIALPRTPLLGRWVELEGLLSRLENPDCRLVTVLGPGGVGKTRLALQAAHDAAKGFANGVLFVPLAGVTSSAAIAPAIIQSLGLPLPPAADAKAVLLAFLRHKAMLLVLDNLEQLLGDAAQHPTADTLTLTATATPAPADADGATLVLELLRHAPELKLLVTSRARLALSEEWLVPLEGLRVDEAAVALFIQSAERVAPEADLSGEERAIREICALVEGFPLAIELAAAWTNLLSCEAIAGEVRASLDVLSSSLRDLPERHRSVRGLFDASWRLLPAERQRTLARLAVFRGGFTVAEAKAVAGASLHDLRALMDASLLRANEGRFDLHELLRQYAAERLAARGEAEGTARRHFEVYAALAEEADRGLFGREQPKWLARLEAETDNLRAALVWGFEHAQAGEVVRLVAALSWFWRQRSFSEARAQVARALRLPELEPEGRALLLYHRGHLAWMRSDYGAAETDLMASLALWDDLGLAGGHTAARARCSLAMTRGMQDRHEDIPALLEPALEVFRAEDDLWWTSFARAWLGKAARALGELDAAKAQLSACLEGYRRLGNPWGLGLFLGSAAELHLGAGDVKEARALAEEAVALLREIGHKHALSAVVWTLGDIARAEGRPAAARAAYERALALYRELGADRLAARVAGELAGLKLEREAGRRTAE